MPKNYYSVLGVAQDATGEQIRRRFKDLARIHHPDRHRGDDKDQAELEFQNLTEAFNVLNNSERRRQHDLSLSQNQRSAGGEGGDARSEARSYMQTGVREFKNRQYAGATDSFRKATEADPKNPQAWHHLALALGQQPRFRVEAAKAIERAIELDPLRPTYHKLAGQLYARIGRIEKAQRAYREALKWGDDDPAVHEAMGELRRRVKGGTSSRFGRSS